METRVDHNKITISYWKLEQAWGLSRVLISLDPMILTWFITYPSSNHALFYFLSEKREIRRWGKKRKKDRLIAGLVYSRN